MYTDGDECLVPIYHGEMGEEGGRKLTLMA
jgi:hypothetical protein